MPTSDTQHRLEAGHLSGSDTEIRDPDDDRFGFSDYARVLAAQARRADTPLTIGIFGH